jgi:hypothetical protein
MTDWITVPSPPLLRPSAPLLIQAAEVDELRRFLGGQGVGLLEVNIGDAASTLDVIGALKAVLPFPSWCGSGWDSIDDAFAELRDGWSFPLVLVVDGLRVLLSRQPHLGLETVIRLNELANAFSTVGDQFVVVFVAESWL